MNIPIVKVVTKHFILIDNYTPTNSIKLHLSWNELCAFYLIDLRNETVHIIASWCDSTDLWCVSTDDNGVTTGLSVIDLMYNKYITSLLLIKMLKAYKRVETLNHNYYHINNPGKQQ